MQAAADWAAMKPASVHRASGGEASIADDGTIRVATAAEKDVYTVEIPIDPAVFQQRAYRCNSTGNTAIWRHCPAVERGTAVAILSSRNCKAQIVPAGQTAPDCSDCAN